MVTVVEILNRAARKCSVTAPASWVSATDPTALEIKDFLDETREDIANRCDWIGPICKTVVITGNGTEDYDLPEDFFRLQRDDYAVYERFRTRRPCVPITRDGEWEYLDELGVTGANRYYRLRGYENNWVISFKDALETDLTVVVNYVSTNWIAGVASPTWVDDGDELVADWLEDPDRVKSEFDDEEDVCLLPRRLVEAGIVYRFRLRKGLPYQDVLAEYEILMARASADTRTRRTINITGRAKVRSPFDIPIPDFIPPT